MRHHNNGRFVSEVPRVAGTRFIQVREDLLKIVESKAVCAALLDQLIYFADVSGWQPFEKSFPDLEEAIMKMRCQKTIRETILPKLEQLGLIKYQKTEGLTTIITVNLETINTALLNAYPQQPQPRKNFQSTPEKLPEHPGKTSGVKPGPSLLGFKDLKDSPLPPNWGDAEIVSFLHDQAVKHGVKVRFTGKQKDWLRENEDVGVSEGFRKLALTIMAIHRGRRINVTEAIMAAVGYSVGRSAGPSRGPGSPVNRQRSRDAKFTTADINPGVAKFEAELRARGVKTD